MVEHEFLSLDNDPGLFVEQGVSLTTVKSGVSMKNGVDPVSQHL